jgi:hypothetical protein
VTLRSRSTTAPEELPDMCPISMRIPSLYKP